MLSRPATPLDRVGVRRHRPGLVDELLADPLTRVVVTRGERILVRRGPSGVAVDYLTPDQALKRFQDPVPALFASLGRAPQELVLLALPAVPPDVGPYDEPDDWAGIRDLLPEADLTDASVVTAALGLAQWHLSHGFCPNCGSATEIGAAGWVRRCPGCGAQHFPRTDPAVIMAVLDDEDRLLLGRQGRWPPGRFSVLAGFVEPGETIEDAVRRETLEETGIPVGEVEYQGSEPWPMPRSLMLGFRAHALATEITVDIDDELAEADWWTRDALRDAYGAGRIALPGRMSIARRLIEQWYGAELDGPPDPR